MTDVRFPTSSRSGAPIYQSLRRTGTREILTIHVDEHQANGDACILCSSVNIAGPDSIAYGRLLGASTDLVACGSCVAAWPDGLP